MHLIELKIENVKRINVVTITPEGNLCVIGGDHDQGKSTALDSLEYVLGGKAVLPPLALRRGTTKGRIVAKLGGESKGVLAMTVTRTFGKNGRTALDITTADGCPARSPQTLLESFYSQVAFDPSLFFAMKPKQQAEAVRELLGLDFEESDRNRQVLYDQRTIVNREAKSLDSQLEGTPKHEGMPEAEVSVSELSAELERCTTHNTANTRVRDKLPVVTKEHKRLNDEVTKLKEDLKVAEDALREGVQLAFSQDEAMVSIHEQIESLQDEDTDAVQEQIATAEETNRTIRQNALHAKLQKQLADKEEASAELTRKIVKIDEDKQSQIESADFPVEGMGFGDDGLTYDDLPIDQINTATQITISVAMGFSANPEFPLVLIRHGSLMAVDHLPLIVELAEKYDGQVLMERIGKGAECHVIIEDGMVQGDGDENGQ